MSDTKPVEKPQCIEHVYTRDIYRYSGRGPSGFTMHYNRKQCSRAARPGMQHCWQHGRP